MCFKLDYPDYADNKDGRRKKINFQGKKLGGKRGWRSYNINTHKPKLIFGTKHYKLPKIYIKNLKSLRLPETCLMKRAENKSKCQQIITNYIGFIFSPNKYC